MCESGIITRWGQVVAQGKLRGQLPELRSEHMVLTIGLFDGIAALRVAVDALGLYRALAMCLSKRKELGGLLKPIFPRRCTSWMLHWLTLSWFSGGVVAVVLLGAAPPCQGSAASMLTDGPCGTSGPACSFMSVVYWRIASPFLPLGAGPPVHGKRGVDGRQGQKHHVSEDFGSDPFRCDAGTLTWWSSALLLDYMGTFSTGAPWPVTPSWRWHCMPTLT